MRRLLTLPGFVLLMVGLPSPALSEDRETRCNRYAESAIAQQTINTSRNCGLTGPEWSADHAYHYSWCVAGANSAPEKLDAQRRARDHKIVWGENCTGHDHGEFSCAAYSSQAVAAQVTNKFLGCALTGPQWNADWTYHYKWCSAGNNYFKFAGGQQADRKAAIEKCSGCWNYAYTARAQNEWNAKKQCGLKGPAWSSDFEYHYNWCMAGENLEKFSRGQTLARWEALESCS